MEDRQRNPLSFAVEVDVEIVSYFNSQYKAKIGPRLCFDGMNCNPLNQQDSHGLEVPFNEEKMHNAIPNLGTLKSLGPNRTKNDFFFLNYGTF